ncbi:MAG: accessory Sec system translocase SecA2 [Clostridia bacterium]|nr:accessory Sec system translocase SecA2 [Clostridia bacterium]
MAKAKFTEMFDPSGVFIERNESVVEEIKEIDFEGRSDYSLKVFAQWIRGQIKDPAEAKKYLIPVFALTREAAKRVLGLQAYDCQILAGIAMFEGKLTEMYTGEGKTLAAVMPAALHAISGHRVHILTFNDYLVKRDFDQMGKVFEFLGLSVGYIVADTPREIRRELYNRDILYITIKECGFDYLRDFLATKEEEIVQSRFQYAIVDEADSMLIDEARVPLVIAGDVPYNDSIVKQAAKLAKKLQVNTHFKIDGFTNAIGLTEKGILVIERLLGVENLYAEENMEMLQCITNALTAEHTLKIDKDYIVKDGKLLIVDEFTGRVVENRHYPEGLQAAVEIKEGIETNSSGMILSQITIQYFMRMYKRMTGMTGTAKTSASEFYDMYGLQIISVPPNKPLIRKDREDSVYQTKDAKMRAVITETINQHKSGRPVLIGTTTVEESEWLADELRRAGVFTQVLNAKHDADEAKVISRAGQLGAVTVSTNMAGRGVDIKLGGASEKNRDKIVNLGGLFVIGTSHYESRRIDNQLRGRAGRQGDPGETHFCCSIEDELMVKFGLKQLLPRYAFQGGSSQVVRDKRVLVEIERVQRIAEGYYQEMRQQLSQYTSIIDDQRRSIHSKHYNILTGDMEPRILATANPAKAIRLQKAFGKEKVALIERQLILHYMNRCWAEYLEYITGVRQGIHLVVIGGKVPLDEFRREAIVAFSAMFKHIEECVVNAFDTVVVNENGVDLEKSNLKGPTSTWTYLIDESADQFSRMPEIFRKLAGKTKDDDDDDDE